MRPGARGLERVALVLPATLLLGVSVVLPAARVVQLGFQRTILRGGLDASFAGLDQYARVLHDGRWWSALGTTGVFTGISTALELLLGIAFAVLLDRRFPLRRWVRASVLVPWALPTAVMAMAWGWIFNDAFGVLDDLLLRTGLLHAPVAWLGDPRGAMAAMIVADVWKTTPFVALVVLAGLQSVPPELVEAARLDGASSWAVFRHITLPLVRPACMVALAFRVAQAFGAFDLPFVLTGGGPGGATETVSLYAYRCFYRYLDFGYGAAVAVTGTLVALALFAVLLALARDDAEAA